MYYSSDLNHNHDQNISQLNRQIISNECKSKVIEDISERPSKIVHKELLNVSDPVIMENFTLSDMWNVYVKTYIMPEHPNYRRYRKTLRKFTKLWTLFWRKRLKITILC